MTEKKNGQFVFPSVHFICILFPLRSLRNTLKKQIPPEFHAQSSTVHKGITHSAFSKMHITNLTTTSSLGKGSFCTFLWGEASKDHTSLIPQPQTLGWGYDQCPLWCSGLGGSHILTLFEKVVFFFFYCLTVQPGHKQTSPEAIGLWSFGLLLKTTYGHTLSLSHSS